MTYERFAEILLEYNIPEEKIRSIWNTRPHDNLDEKKIRYAAERTAEMLHATKH